MFSKLESLMEVIVHLTSDNIQFYRLARSNALQKVFPDFVMDVEAEIYRDKNFRYPRPYSEPPSPNSSRPTTPGTSIRGDSDDDEDEVDSENEVYIRN